MFETKTYESIMEDMLDRIPDNLDKREGSVIYTVIGPIAMELAQAYSDLETLMDETFADTASMYYLLKRAAERNVNLIEGTPCVIRIHVEPDTVTVPDGTEFNIGEMNYRCTLSEGNGNYLLTCTETGTEGNAVSSDIVPMETIQNLESVTLVKIVTLGTDDEDVESFRDRYFTSLSDKEFGGNKAEYRQRVLAMEGVGAVRVYPVWNGGGTVKIVILSNDYGIADSSVVFSVQNKLDPTGDGSGMGLAPIGHVVTVQTAGTVPVNVTASIEYQDGYSWSDISQEANEKIEAYLKELRSTFDDTEYIVVRRSRIETELLSIDGVLDVSDVTLNGGQSTVQVTGSNVPVKGVISDGS